MAAKSQLEFRSIGFVAMNKARNSKEIEVSLAEENPFLDGELTDNADVIAVQGSGSEGRAAFDVNLTVTATKKATWIQFGTNRSTPPDVRRGMRVKVYQFGDDDKYWWSAVGDDEHLMKLETVVYRFSGSQVEGAGIDPTKDYYLEVSTHDGMVHWHTSDANGELTTWDVQFDTKVGKFVITDGLGNFGTIESKTGHIEFQNYKGTYFRMAGKDITGYAISKTTWTAPDGTTWNGDFLLKGNLDVTGNATIGGNLGIGGNGECAGTFTAGKIISIQNAQAPNI